MYHESDHIKVWAGSASQFREEQRLPVENIQKYEQFLRIFKFNNWRNFQTLCQVVAIHILSQNLFSI